MKQGIHPENYRPVVFKDMSVDHHQQPYHE